MIVRLREVARDFGNDLTLWLDEDKVDVVAIRGVGLQVTQRPDKNHPLQKDKQDRECGVYLLPFALIKTIASESPLTVVASTSRAAPRVSPKG